MLKELARRLERLAQHVPEPAKPEHLDHVVDASIFALGTWEEVICAELERRVDTFESFQQGEPYPDDLQEFVARYSRLIPQSTSKTPADFIRENERPEVKRIVRSLMLSAVEGAELPDRDIVISVLRWLKKDILLHHPQIAHDYRIA